MKACPLCGSLVSYEGMHDIECHGVDCQNYHTRKHLLSSSGEPESGDYLWALKQAYSVEYFDALSGEWREYLPSNWYGQPGRFIPQKWRKK